MTAFWQRFGELLSRHRHVALVTVAEARGSTPRAAGARMIVTPDGGYSGSIGGGALEYEALALASRQLSSGGQGALMRRVSLGPGLGQCCGGHVTLVIETVDAGRQDEVARLAALEAPGDLVTRAKVVEGAPIHRSVDHGGFDGEAVLESDGTLLESFADRRHHIMLFGAGHVGRALVLALGPLPVRVTWIDSRADAFPSVLPSNVTAHRTPAPAESLADAPRGTFVLVMTHSHPLDLEICRAALGSPDIAYVGLIGSATKRARFVGRLRAAGLPADAVDRLVCPIGLPGLLGKAPPVIAASVAADMLLRIERAETASVVEIPGENRPVEVL